MNVCGKIADNSFFIRCRSDKKSPQEIVLFELASCFSLMNLVVFQILYVKQASNRCDEICYGQQQTHLHAYGLNKTIQLDPFSSPSSWIVFKMKIKCFTCDAFPFHRPFLSHPRFWFQQRFVRMKIDENGAEKKKQGIFFLTLHIIHLVWWCLQIRYIQVYFEIDIYSVIKICGLFFTKNNVLEHLNKVKLDVPHFS